MSTSSWLPLQTQWFSECVSEGVLRGYGGLVIPVCQWLVKSVQSWPMGWRSLLVRGGCASSPGRWQEPGQLTDPCGPGVPGMGQVLQAASPAGCCTWPAEDRQLAAAPCMASPPRRGRAGQPGARVAGPAPQGPCSPGPAARRRLRRQALPSGLSRGGGGRCGAVWAFCPAPAAHQVSINSCRT